LYNKLKRTLRIPPIAAEVETAIAATMIAAVIAVAVVGTIVAVSRNR